jgi:hypothetical protein
MIVRQSLVRKTLSRSYTHSLSPIRFPSIFRNRSIPAGFRVPAVMEGGATFKGWKP